MANSGQRVHLDIVPTYLLVSHIYYMKFWLVVWWCKANNMVCHTTHDLQKYMHCLVGIANAGIKHSGFISQLDCSLIIKLLTYEALL